MSLCVLSCLSVRQTALNYSLRPLRELSITSFSESVCVCLCWDVAFPASCPRHPICLCHLLSLSLSLPLLTVSVSLLLHLVVHLKSTRRWSGWVRAEERRARSLKSLDTRLSSPRRHPPCVCLCAVCRAAHAVRTCSVAARAAVMHVISMCLQVGTRTHVLKDVTKCR